MHPWERDARLLWEAVYKGPKYGILVEIACTRSSEELLGARRAYHSLFEHSIEEDIAFHIHSFEKKVNQKTLILCSFQWFMSHQCVTPKLHTLAYWQRVTRLWSHAFEFFITSNIVDVETNMGPT